MLFAQILSDGCPFTLDFTSARLIPLAVAITVGLTMHPCSQGISHKLGVAHIWLH